MTDKFKVGDIVILIKCYNFPELLGKEMTITELPKLRYGVLSQQEFVGYGTDFVYNGLLLTPEEHQLKLKTFDGEQKVFDMFESLNVTKEKAEELV